MANANLKTLEVGNFSIYPDFKRNIYNYNLTINHIKCYFRNYKKGNN